MKAIVFCLKQQSKLIIHFDYFRAVLKRPKKIREQLLLQTIQLNTERLHYDCLQGPLRWFNFFDFWRVENESE